MQYRHTYHAGNFADVHKHVTLLALCRALQRKDTGWLYVDTHAGRGSYGAEAGGKPLELDRGYGLLRGAQPRSAELRDYLDVQQALLSAAGGALATAKTQTSPRYAGSALLMAQVLRAQDRGVCCELQPQECRALQRALQQWPRMRVHCGDGFAALAAHLPPVERRALLLVDPPYEDTAGDFNATLSALRSALARLSSAVALLWFPIKDRRELAPWLRQAQQLLERPTLLAQLWMHPCDSRVALNGSGLLIVNPPYLCEQHMAQWLPELARCLQVGADGGTAISRLIDERH